MNDSMKMVGSNYLLEFAANNNVEGFKRLITPIASAINEVGLWYGRQRNSKRMLMEHRTPLMIAATYGSLDVVKLILSLSEADVNSSCGPDKTTSLHCAASSGSVNAFDVIKILLKSGADPELVDADGRRPVDVVFVPPNLSGMKDSLEKLLQNGAYGIEQEDFGLASLKSNLDCVCMSYEKKEYPIDPFFPDLKSDAYSTDEFRMFAFKIRPCSRAYSHDWTECPFIHPGESARRRDPRKIHYSCVPCPDFKKGQCRLGDVCEFAHGVFECWLHPAQYRTRLCKDENFCARRVCFFAHTPEELRPLYVSSGSAMPSPRGSPAAASTMSPPPFSPPPTMQLHDGNLQASRLRLSFNARDIQAEEVKLLLDLEMNQRHQSLVKETAAKGSEMEPPPETEKKKDMGAWFANMQLDEMVVWYDSNRDSGPRRE
ncbi:Ankyrin repeat-containing protein, partial [Cynara cardunculus var. scolymus]